MGIERAEEVIKVLTEWGERTREVRALWLAGSFASGTADRFSDIDLRGCVESEEFDFFSSVEDALSGLEGWSVLKRREFSGDRADSEMVVDFPDGLCLDFHVVVPDGLNDSYFDPYRMRILIDEGCDLARFHSSARREHACRKPADEKTRISRAVGAWAFLGHAGAEAVRGRQTYALSLLEGAGAALRERGASLEQAAAAGHKKKTPAALEAPRGECFCFDKRRVYS